MIRSLFISLSISMLTFLAGCDSWVENVGAPETVITDDQLTNETQVNFLTRGIVLKFFQVNSAIALLSADLSDEFFFNPQLRWTNLQEIDEAQISMFNGEIEWPYVLISQLRFHADDLVRRSAEIQFQDQELKRRALHTGYLYGAIARYYQAAYYGLGEREGGGVITVDPEQPGSFIPSDEMYELALAKLDSAASNAVSPEDARIVKTIAARIYLILGDLGSARSAAESGMISGDPAFQSLHDVTIRNRFWEVNRFNPYLLPDSAYKEYVEADPAEAIRLPLARDSLLVVVNRDSTYYRFYAQTRYTSRSDPVSFCTWQENELILAELDLADGNTSGALMHVNTVRAAYGLDHLTFIDRKILEDERRKELWLMGLRLIDQRRFDTWHKGPNTWLFLPIPQAERDRNPNL